jgi:hypothetical protein
MTDKLQEQLDMKEKQIKFLQKKCRDAGNLINELKLRHEQETQSLKNVIDMKEVQNSELRKVNDDHKKLNGELRKEISNLKKEAKDMLQYP